MGLKFGAAWGFESFSTHHGFFRMTRLMRPAFFKPENQSSLWGLEGEIEGN